MTKTLEVRSTDLFAAPKTRWSPASPDARSIEVVAAAPGAGGRATLARVANGYAGGYWMGGLGLIRPVRAVLQFSSGHCTAVEPHTGVFGAGGSVAAALQDLRVALREHCEVLQSQVGLSSDLAAQLEFLQQHVAVG